jgi:hypothetical protein
VAGADGVMLRRVLGGAAGDSGGEVPLLRIAVER